MHTPSVHRQFAAKEAARRRPSTSMMDCEGIIYNADGLASQLKQEACALLERARPP